MFACPPDRLEYHGTAMLVTKMMTVVLALATEARGDVASQIVDGTTTTTTNQ